MSLLSVIQQHCRIHALSVPTSVFGSVETTTNQLYGILNEILDELVTESKFNVTTQECLFTTVATESQGTMAALCPLGYQYAILETFFDRTTKRALIGPLTETEWQEIKALPTAGIMYKYRIRNDTLLFNPVPAAPHSQIAFEYMSSYCITSSAGVLKAAFTADSDLFVFPEYLVRKGMMYRWKQIKGLPYQADETKYYSLLNNYIARDKVKRRINVADGGGGEVRPGIFVPSNSWPVS